MSIIIDVKDLVKTFNVGSEPIEVLKGLSLQVKKGEFIAIMGPSGSGKSTLLNILASIEDVTTGHLLIDDKDISRANLVEMRRYKTSIIYQDFNLLPYLSAIENVLFPMMLCGVKENDARKKALALLERVHMSHRVNHTPDDLSGGEKQRVAVARSLANDPRILLADEPTGDLDSKTGDSIIELFKEIVLDHAVTIIIVTHDIKIAQKTDRILILREGVLHHETDIMELN